MVKDQDILPAQLNMQVDGAATVSHSHLPCQWISRVPERRYGADNRAMQIVGGESFCAVEPACVLSARAGLTKGISHSMHVPSGCQLHAHVQRQMGDSQRRWVHCPSHCLQ